MCAQIIPKLEIDTEMWVTIPKRCDNKHYIGLSREIANRKIFSHENIIHYETLARQVIKSLNTLKHSN